MEEIRKKNSPKSKGWYLCLKHDETPFIMYVSHPLQDNKYVVSVPWDFSNNPNLSHVFNPITWSITEIDKSTKNLSIWNPLKQILPLEKCIGNNVDLEMEYRLSLVGSTIKIDDIEYKITDTYHHIHVWTIFNIENIETKEIRQLQLQKYDNWSFGGIDEIDVEIL